MLFILDHLRLLSMLPPLTPYYFHLHYSPSVLRYSMSPSPSHNYSMHHSHLVPYNNNLYLSVQSVLVHYNYCLLHYLSLYYMCYHYTICMLSMSFILDHLYSSLMLLLYSHFHYCLHCLPLVLHYSMSLFMLHNYFHFTAHQTLYNIHISSLALSALCMYMSVLYISVYYMYYYYTIYM